MLVKLEYEGAAGDTAGGACDEREMAWIDSSTTGYQPIRQIWVFLRA